MSVALSQPTRVAQTSPSFGEGRIFSEVEQAVLWTLLQQDPSAPAETYSPKPRSIKFGLG
jgi:hypothetical protein